MIFGTEDMLSRLISKGFTEARSAWDQTWDEEPELNLPHVKECCCEVCRKIRLSDKKHQEWSQKRSQILIFRSKIEDVSHLFHSTQLLDDKDIRNRSMERLLERIQSVKKGW